MAQMTIAEKHQNTLIALAVHAFTASGVVLAMLAAVAAYQLDWTVFFAITAVSAIPSMALLWWLQMRRHFAALEKPKVIAADD